MNNNAHNNNTHNNRNSKCFSNLSRELIANIIGFMDMKDRLLNCERVCAKLYHACQTGIAKTGLYINKSFVRNALNDNLDISKFMDIKYLRINFVLCNQAIRTSPDKVGQEAKYYKILNDIILNSPYLKTLEYNLTENAFRSHLGDSDKWNKQYHGNLFDVVSNYRVYQEYILIN